MINPLLDQHELPPFGEIRAQHMTPAIQTILSDIRVRIAELLTSEGTMSYQSLVAAREALEDRLWQAWSPISHLNAVASTDEIRDAHEKCLALISEYETEMDQHAGLFAAYQQIRNSSEFETLGQAERKVVDNALRDFRLSGIDLAVEDQARYAVLAQELARLGSLFSNNVLDSTQAWSKLISTRSELAGVSDSALALMEQAATAHDYKEGLLLTLDAPCYLAVMAFCDDELIREEMYRAYGTRASDQGPHSAEFDNSETMREILKSRLEQSKLLGFENFAQLSLERKMARSTDEVLEFLHSLAEKCKASAYGELAEIEQFMVQLTDKRTLNPWDVPYFAEKLKKAKFDISEEELRPYFPVPKVMSGMFEVVRRLYDIEVVPVTNMPVWHADVLTYEIQRRGVVIARFFVDLYTRTNKRGGAWMNDCRNRRVDINGNLQLPVAYLTCNFTSAIGGNPALLSHNEVVTLFHEFGHGLHQMLTKMTALNVSGINGVAWDAVELPSQFMENFCWQQESLALISGHYQSGESLPDDLLEKLLSAKNFQSAMMMMRQLEFGLFDFSLHQEFDPEQPSQIGDLLDQVRGAVAVIEPPSYYRFQHGFSHIFGGGYAAGYYSYKWAEVLSADAFARFLQDGIFNRQTGEEFLSTVLEKGGSEDAMDLFIAFRGREPDVGALLLQEGIGQKAA